MKPGIFVLETFPSFTAFEIGTCIVYVVILPTANKPQEGGDSLIIKNFLTQSVKFPKDLHESSSNLVSLFLSLVCLGVNGKHKNGIPSTNFSNSNWGYARIFRIYDFFFHGVNSL